MHKYVNKERGKEGERMEEALVGKKKSPAQKAVRKTLKGTAQLAKLLPTGTVLAFQILAPAVTQQGQCPTAGRRSATAVLLGCCAASCFLLSFTDSVRDARGKVRYGIATRRGLWVVEEWVVEDGERYRVRAMDVAHAVASVAVFGAVAALEQNVVRCFWPRPSEDVKEMLMGLPLLVGLLCSLFFLAFPSSRHGIGFPLSPN